MQIQCFAATEKMDRKDNQDFFFSDKEARLYIVADGMGGYAGGGYASKFVPAFAKQVIKTMDSLVKRTDEDTFMPGNPPMTYNYENILRGAFLETHVQMIKAAGATDLKGMGATLVLLLFRGDRLYIMNAGDCRCYQYSEGTLRQLTRDHSKVEDMLREGKVSKEEARVHPERNIVRRWIGGDKFGGTPDTYVVPYYANDRFILCTDGVHKILTDSEIESYARMKDIKEAVSGMMDAIKTAPPDIHPTTGGERKKDNATVTIVEVFEAPMRHDDSVRV